MEPPYPVGRNVLVQPQEKTVRQVLKRLNIELPYDPTMPLNPFHLLDPGEKPSGNTTVCR